MNTNRPFRLAHHTRVAETSPNSEIQRKCAFPGRPDIATRVVLGLISLAVLILLWGTSAKLSRYYRHNLSKSTFSARMWVEPRTPILTAGCRVRNCYHGSRSANNLFESPYTIQPVSRPIGWINIGPQACISGASFSHLLRAPPYKF